MARPREFDASKALNQMMGVFWARGYEGTSISDLMSVTGMAKQSLYSAFGNKCAIYLAVLENYEQTRMRPIADMLRGSGPANERIGRMLQSVIDAAGKSQNRRGCMIGNAAIDHAVLDKKAQDKVLNCVKKMEKTMSTALEEMAPYDKDTAARRSRGRVLLATYFGMQVMAKAGVGRAVLSDMRDAALNDLGAGSS